MPWNQNFCSVLVYRCLQNKREIYVKSVCYYTKKFSKVTFTLAKELPWKRSRSVSKLLEALAHLIFTLYKTQQKARDTDKVWKKKLKKDFGAPLKKYSKSNMCYWNFYFLGVNLIFHILIFLELFFLCYWNFEFLRVDLIFFIFLLKNACNNSKKVPH